MAHTEDRLDAGGAGRSCTAGDLLSRDRRPVEAGYSARATQTADLRREMLFALTINVRISLYV